MKLFPRANRSRGFTLIELLVVIAIIAILAAMLMPALETAKDRAKRASCLSDKRQFFLTFTFFGNDYNHRLPSQIPDWDGGNDGIYPEPVSNIDPLERMVDSINSRNHGCHALEQKYSGLKPLGVLAAYGYIDSPDIFFSAGFKRNNCGGMRWYWPDGYKTSGHYYGCEEMEYWPYYPYGGEDVWGDIIDGDDSFGRWTFCAYTGIALYYWKGHARPSDQPRIRLIDIGRLWNQPGEEMSPMILSCAQYEDTIFGQNTHHNHAHKRRGVNGVFYDGSARWISLKEVKADGVRVCSPSGPLDAEFYLNNDTWGTECRDNLQMWAKQCATLRPD